MHGLLALRRIDLAHIDEVHGNAFWQAGPHAVPGPCQAQLASSHEESRRIALSVIRFAVSLGKTAATAEGVETQEQREILRAQACDEMQGYCFSRPKPARDLARLLGKSARARADAA